jgi:UDP-glucose 4-epimerase
LILNCGSGFGYSVFEIVKLFEIASKKSIELIVKPKRQGDITSIYSDTTFFMGALYTWNTMQCHLIYNDIQQGISMAGLIMRV